MSRLLRLAMVASATMILALPLTASAQGTAGPAWPQAVSDIKPDPQVRFGQLSNGMRYAIMHNTTPAHQTSLRLRIGSGSLEESEDQRGLAHFLEHMAFKGSTNVPEGEMVKLLERHGLAFGPDTNAFTAWTQTVFMLDLPESDKETLDLGMMLMRETAGNLTLTQKAMDPERGVVLSEERVRDTPDFETIVKRLAFTMQGQLAPERLPIGKVDVLKTAPVSRIRTYYEANYRPERATLIVVGDIDVDKVEVDIKARFSDWKGVGPATKEPDLGAVAKRGEQARVVVQTGATASVQVGWAKPFDTAPDSYAKEEGDHVEALGLSVLNRRLERLARSDHPPFTGAAAGASDSFDSMHFTALSINPQGADWRGGLIAAEEERRRLLQYGVTAEELQREVTNKRTEMQTEVARASTRPTPSLAESMVNDVDIKNVICTPAENLAIFERAVKDLKVEDVNAALKRAFSGSGPLIFLVSPTPVDGSDAALSAAFHEAEAATLAAPAATTTAVWPYTHFGTTGRVVEQKSIPDLGITLVRFANGVRLSFKQTDYRKDEILVSFNLPGGRLALPKDRETPSWAASALTLGGLKAMTLEDTQRALTGKVVSAGPAFGEDSVALAGSTRPVDLDTELQFLTAYLSEPGWRPSGFERLQKAVAPQIDNLDSTAGGVLAKHLESLMHPGDHRWDFPTKAEVADAKLSDLRSQWDAPMASGPVQVNIVGDLTLNDAIAAVAKTVGSLPPRGAEQPLPAGTKLLQFPAPTQTPVVLTHKGRPDQAVAYEAWRTNDFYANRQEAWTMKIMAGVLQLRLLDRLRIAEGATYSPSAASQESSLYPGDGYVTANVETPPDKVASFYRATADISADLRNTPVTPDELERARKPVIEQIIKGRQTNTHWLSVMAAGAKDPRAYDIQRDSVAGFNRITPADVQAVAKKYLREDRAYKLVVEPAAADAAPVAK